MKDATFASGQLHSVGEEVDCFSSRMKLLETQLPNFIGKRFIQVGSLVNIAP
jgi:hypothetical protein